MPTVVLRHPDIAVPTLVEVGPDGIVPRFYAEGGFEIDSKTEPNAAMQEISDYEAAQTVEAAENPPVIRFAPDPDATPAPDAPAEQTAPVQASKPAPNQPAEPVTQKEN